MAAVWLVLMGLAIRAHRRLKVNQDKERELLESLEKSSDRESQLQDLRAFDERQEERIGEGYEREVPDPLGKGLKLSVQLLAGVAVATVAVIILVRVFSVGVPVSRWVWATLALVAAFGVAVCFGYAYTARRIGVRRARNIFYIALAIGLIGFVYALMRLIPRL